MIRLSPCLILAGLVAAAIPGAAGEEPRPAASPEPAVETVSEPGAEPLAREVVVEVTVPEGSRGKVVVALMASKEDYADWAARYGGQAEPVDGVARVVFADVPYGRYLATAFQDRNGNDFLDTNDLKMPQEPYGFSRDAFGFFGMPPRWEKGAFDVDRTEVAIALTLKDRGKRQDPSSEDTAGDNAQSRMSRATHPGIQPGE